MNMNRDGFYALFKVIEDITKLLLKTPNRSDSERCVIGRTAALINIVSPMKAFAATGVHENNVGSGLVWIFLGLLALIVVGQIIPAVLLMFGMGKGLKSVVKDEMAAVKK